MVHTTVLVPQRNAGAELATRIPRLCQKLATIGRPFEVIVIDDASAPSSNQHLVRMIPDHAALRLIRMDRPCGTSAALTAGIAASRGEVGALLTEGAVHQGVAMEVSALPATALDAVCHPDATSRLVVLDRVNDPQNLGAVLRVAAAFEASAVIVPDRHAPGESGALAKAASGTLEIVPLVRVPNVAQALERLKQDGYWCIGLDGGAANTIAQSRPAGATALVLGAEGDGLRRLTRERCDALARLPISDKVESLNLATAAAVALYALTNDA